MGSKEKQWAKWIDLGGLFVVHWTIPRLDMLEGFLRTWESIEDGQIWAIVNGERITIDQALIVKQFSVNTEGAMDVTNALVKEVEVALKNIAKLDAFVNKE